MESNKSLMQQIADLLASGELGFHPYSWAFGVVDVAIVPRLFPERIVRISVPEDDWNDGPLDGTAKTLAKLVENGDLKIAVGYKNIEEEKEKITMKRYIALYKDSAVRDTQICKEDPDAVSLVDDDVWEDWPDAPVYIGLFSAMSEVEAKKAAAESQGCSPACIWLISLDENGEFGYLLKFAAGADFETGELAEKQLRALWTAFCFHESLDVDTVEYDAKLQALYQQLPGDRASCSWYDYEGFGRYMCELLV